MSRELRIFLISIVLPVLFLGWYGNHLLSSAAQHLAETDRLVLGSIAQRAADGFHNLVHAEIDGALDELELLSPTNDFAAAAQNVERTNPWVRRIYSVRRKSARKFPLDRRVSVNDRVPSIRLMVPSQATPLVLELEPIYALSRLPGVFKRLGVDNPEDTSARATIAEVRDVDDTILCPPTSKPPAGGFYGEVPLGGTFPRWKIRVYRRYGAVAFESERMRLVMVGGIGLLLILGLLSAGGAILLYMTVGARRDARVKANFIAMMSHEFKTPLTTIGLCTELALEDELDKDERQRAALSIKREAERLQRFLQGVLDVSRLEAGHYVLYQTWFDIAELIRTLAGAMADRVAHPAQVATGSCLVCADRAAVELIVVNLLENARKYAGKSPVEVTFGASDRPDYRVIHFADRGPGLTPQQCQRVFDRFWRANDFNKKAANGSGIGMYIARRLARGMKGDLRVRTREGGGCVFTLELPASPPEKVDHG